jgi:aspartate aminotransferase
MPSISDKGRHMPSSPIRKLAPFAEAAKKRGTKIYHLNIGQPDIATPDAFWKAVKDIDLKVLAYSPSDGFEALKKKYAGWFTKKFGQEYFAPSDMLITTGASEALLFTLLSILDEGEEIIATEPTYANYIGFMNSGSIRFKPVATHFDQGFALPSTDEFEAAIGPQTKAILLCNPGNPTGVLYSKAELERIKDLALKHDLFIISDEVYQDFNYSGEPFVSMMHFPELAHHAIVVDSISKRYSACGARIGMVATKNKEVLGTILKFAQQRLSPPTIEQLGAEALFDVDMSYLEDVYAEYIQRRDVLVEGLNGIPGVQCHTPKGAFYCMVKLPVTDSDHFCQWMLEAFEYEGATVMMAPAAGFFVTPGLGKDMVRVAYVLRQEDLKAAVECLRKGLEVYALQA